VGDVRERRRRVMRLPAACVLVAAVITGCSSTDPTEPDPCAEALGVVADLQAELDALPAATPGAGGRPGASTWWAPRADDPHADIVERWAYVVQEEPSCFSVEERAQAQQVIDILDP
jgi:hypothetical protein